MEERQLRKTIIHNPNVPVRRKRKPLKVSKDMQRAQSEIKMQARQRRAALDAENKRIQAGGKPKSADKAPEASTAASNQDSVPVESTQKASEASTAYIGTKDGKSYAQERHAETLAKKLKLSKDAIKETDDGYVLEIPADEIPEGHEAVEGVKLKK